MRVAIDGTCCWNRRGFGRFTVQLLRALLARADGHAYTLLVDRDPDPAELPGTCEVVNVSPRRTVVSSAVAGDRRSLGDLWAFTRAVRRLRPDLFFFPAVYSYFPLPPGLRSVVCFHDTIAEDLPELVFPDWRGRLAWNLKCRLALAQATRVMTVSETSAGRLATRFRIARDRIDVVTEGPGACFRVLDDEARVAATRARLGVPGPGPYLLYVGGVSPHKNLRSLIRAMERVLHEREASLVIVGDPKADGFHANHGELVAMIEGEAALRRACRFTGFVPDEELVALYNGAYALVFPSLGEGFGLPAVEAMACGTPVLASRAGSLPEIVGEAGVFFDPRDPDSIADAILDLLRDPAARDALAARARARASRFSWERAAELALASFARACP